MVFQEGADGGGAAGGGAAGGGAGAAGAGGAGAAKPDAGAGAGAGAKPDAGGGATPPWYDGFKDPATKEWMKSFNADAYPDAEAIASKAMNLEKFVGAEKAGRGVIIPKSDAKPEEWQAFFKKTGLIPEKPDGYKVDAKYAAEPFIAKLREQAHKLGVPAPMFEGLVGFINAENEGAEAAEQKQFEEQTRKELAEIAAEWGDNRDANIENGRRASKAFMPHTDDKDLKAKMQKFEGVMGTKFMMNFWANLGKKMGEHNFHGGDGKGGMGDGGMSPEGARIRVAQLKADKEFGKKIANNDAAAMKEWTELHAIGWPDQPAA